MSASSLATVLQTFSRAEKLEFLERLWPSDAYAIELLLNDCIAHRWDDVHWPDVAEGSSPKPH